LQIGPLEQELRLVPKSEISKSEISQKVKVRQTIINTYLVAAAVVAVLVVLAAAVDLVGAAVEVLLLVVVVVLKNKNIKTTID